MAGRKNKYFPIRLLAFLVMFFPVSLFPQNFQFENFTTEDGLSNNKINVILQDRYGFLWLGTDDGLNRYDGYGFRIFRNVKADSHSISDNNIWSLFEDGSGNIWAGTKDGSLNEYIPGKNVFRRWDLKSMGIVSNGITAVLADDKNIWLGTYQHGLYRINRETKNKDHWFYQASTAKALSNNFVTSIAADPAGYLWVSTYNGLNRADTKSGRVVFETYFNTPGDPNSLPANLVWSAARSGLYPDRLWVGTSRGLALYNHNNNTFSHVSIPAAAEYQFGSSVASLVEEIAGGDTILWIGTYSGLVRIDKTYNRTERFVKLKNEPRSLVSNQINDIILDRSGVIWIATENGLSKISSKSRRFNNYFKSGLYRKLFSELYGKLVRAVCRDKNGKIYFGTDNGIVSIDPLEGKAVNEIPGTAGLNVWSLLMDASNNLWIGTYGQGLKFLDAGSQQLKDINIESPTFKTSAFSYIKSLLQDGNDILIGFWGGGLVSLNTKTGNYKISIKDERDPFSISYNDVWAIEKNNENRIWIGTDGGGLNLFDNSGEGKFYKPVFVEDGRTVSGSKSIYSIYQAKNYTSGDIKDKDILWLGTNDGLCRLKITDRGDNDPASIYLEMKTYIPGNGVAGKPVYNIIEDNNGGLWLSTGGGISFFDAGRKEFINYSNADGIIGEEFYSGAAEIAGDGTIFFGNQGGINYFNPADLTLSAYRQPVLISNFQIFNEEVGIGEDSVLTENIFMTGTINLSYAQNVFSFQLAALDYNFPQSILFAYKMEGFDKNWIYSGTRRFITYTNLGSGDYTFKFKATNSDGVWNESYNSIAINIGLPWWRTPWAYVVYFLLVITGIYALRRIEISRMLLKNELEMKAYEAKRQRDLEIMKSRFFANLSHEFRTPLTLIKGPLEELMNKRAGVNEQEYYRLIHRNSEKLQKLIDELLELTRLENAAIPLRAGKQDLIIIVKGIFSSFESAAKAKNIELSFLAYADRVICWIDRGKLEKILNNLLSNAIKFTPKNGSVVVEIKKLLQPTDEFAEVIVRDTGIGIAKDKLHKIFDRFYKSDDSLNYSGSGIGLALVKELVDLQKWQIKVSSTFGAGTEFSLQIPLNDSYLNEEEKESAPGEALYGTSGDSMYSEDLPEQEIKQEIVETKRILSGRQTILIVEDSADVRTYLKGILSREYRICEAVNGTEGLERSAEILPDLIVSDVMMPGMDGIEFCRKIKTDIRTSHIPVILLTARASPESKLEGLETGADDYLTKPFSSKELYVRIKNLLDQRERLRKIFSREIRIDTARVTVNSLDNSFLTKAVEIARKNMSNADFNSEEFAKEMFLSRSQFHRKLTALTGQGPGEFLRTIRLKQGADLLLEKKLNVAQIAFEVGFNNPSHFSKAFRQMFNCLPTEFSEKTN